jgi:hypothetical protein
MNFLENDYLYFLSLLRRFNPAEPVVEKSVIL